MATPTTILLFGASGDLSHRKLAPGLFSLFRKDRLPEPVNILGLSTSPMTHAEFRQKMLDGVRRYAEYDFSPDEWERFADRLYYLPGSFTDPGVYQQIKKLLADLEGGAANRLYYLATPPRFFSEIPTQLHAAGMLAEDGGWRRVVIEKPFGTNLDSARALNRTLHQVLDEAQIYRIDHYLGKETVQNLLTFRFANSIYEPIWNRDHIDHVQITVAESVDVGSRARYYDGVGVLCDMFQNHLFQLFCFIAMEPPVSFRARDLHEEKAKVLRAVQPIAEQDIGTMAVRGQYNGYRATPGVAPDSRTESFAALCLFIDNWRWQGVPFYLRSGKALAEKRTEVIIQFKAPPTLLFRNAQAPLAMPNILSFCLQPDEGIHQRFEVKVPDTVSDHRAVEMEFHYRDVFAPDAIPDAYERLLLDALNGDPSLFNRADQAEMAWELLEPVLQSWARPDGPPLYSYEPGSWGPFEGEEFLAREGRSWSEICGCHDEPIIYPLLT
jgi:glucose-6-phosphate 1-dehydrogenase